MGKNDIDIGPDRRYRYWNAGRKPRPSCREQPVVVVSSKAVTTQATAVRTPDGSSSPCLRERNTIDSTLCRTS